jgi:hypothetical protein
MTFQIYGHRKTGEVLIEDQRPDGSVVMLVCSEFASRPPGNGSSVAGGPGASHGDDDVAVVTASTRDGGAYPLLSETGRVSRRLPRLHVDTTDMPGGPLRFALRAFGQKALETADGGIREVHMDPASAHEWGWIPDDEAGAAQDLWTGEGLVDDEAAEDVGAEDVGAEDVGAEDVGPDGVTADDDVRSERAPHGGAGARRPSAGPPQRSKR